MKWKTKDGLLIPIKKLSDSHLLNCIRMIERMDRQNLSAAYSCLSSFNPDSMASFYCEQDIDRMEEEPLEDRSPEYAALIEEAERRKLSVDTVTGNGF